MAARHRLIALQLAGLAVVVIWSATVLRDEIEVAAAEDRVHRLSGAIERNERFVTSMPETIHPDAPPRAILADALVWARSAQSRAVKDPLRTEAIRQADTALELLVQRRPYWGDVWTVRALIASVRYGETSQEVRGAFVRSYSDAPFLRSSAPWRIRIGFANWSSLDPTTRTKVIDEALSLLKVDPRLTPTVFAAARGSLAYYPFVLRWRHERQRANGG